MKQINLKRILLAILILMLMVGCQPTAGNKPTSPADGAVSPANTSDAAAAAPTEGGASMSLQVTSPAFAEGQTIPKKYTCDDANVSPELNWSGTPPGTQSFALIVDDPDAPVGTWVHWVLFNIPAGTNRLPEAVQKSAGKVGTRGKNDFPTLEYSGPCPPKGPAHRYFFKVYALDTTLNLPEGAKKADLEKAMKGHILGQGQLIGKYGR